MEGGKVGRRDTGPGRSVRRRVLQVWVQARAPMLGGPPPRCILFTACGFARRPNLRAPGSPAFVEVQRSRLAAQTCSPWVAKLCLQQEVLSPGFMRDVLAAIQPGDVHVTSSCSANFCVGVSSGGEIDREFLAGWPGVWFFCEQLRQQCDLPLIVVCHGATRGGGMFFPLAADVVLACEDATFGLPEIRRGVLPGVVSTYAKPRLTKQQHQRLALTGSQLSASAALAEGLVDFVGTRGEVELCLASLLSSFATIGAADLRAWRCSGRRGRGFRGGAPEPDRGAPHCHHP